jgi:hypothetical protein
MAKKLYAILFLVAALGLGLWAQSTIITMGEKQIEIPDPDFPAPKMDATQVAQLNFFDTDAVVMRAVYGDPKIIEAMATDERDIDVSMKNPFFMAFTVAELDAYDFSEAEFLEMGADMAAGVAQGLSGVTEGEDSDVESAIILGESFRTRFSFGLTVLVKDEVTGKTMIMVLCPTLVKGKLLMLMSGIEYSDNLSINKVERHLRRWSSDIYQANPSRIK